MSVPRDQYQRPLRDLRISVTDRCNMRCRYCMPREVFNQHFKFLPQSLILTFEEIQRLARLFMQAGVQKLRLTGGEPLLRRDLDQLIRLLVELGPEDLALTTNGSLLAENAEGLFNAGLRRITVSLDSLDDSAFQAATDSNVSVRTVLDGIEAAHRAGMRVKVNAVIRRGVNDHTLLDLVRHFRETPHVLRLIEFMDVGATNGWRMDQVVSAEEMMATVQREFPLEPLDAQYPGEVAQRYGFADGRGEIGFITSVTRPFCGSCTRARLSADGRVYRCLFAAQGNDFREVLRDGTSDAGILARIESFWTNRQDRYSQLRQLQTEPPPKVEMSYIGG